MFSHVMVGADDISAAKKFYDACLGALGVAEGAYDEWGRVVYTSDSGRLLITRPIDGHAASGANGGTIGFLARSADEVDAWHATGLASGGTTIENPPGERNATAGRVLYLAYLRDPSGNKICATYRIK